jgi:hypothetical protein
VLGLVLLLPSLALAGGPLVVGGPNYGNDGVPFRWNPAAMPIRYAVVSGPLSKTIDNARGRQLVQSMFGVWQSVPTATISFSYSGPVVGSSGQAIANVSTLDQLNDLLGLCEQGRENPIIFDADGSLIRALGMSGVIGFTNPCPPDSASQSNYVGAAVVMDGQYIDGDTSNDELTQAEFNYAITHELGHFAGLGHSQINESVLNSYPCPADLAAGLPLMFPVLVCDPIANGSDLPVLSPDDLAAISRLYPNAQTPLTYGTLSGRIYFSDGISQVQGVNVIARRVDDPNTPEDESLRIAISAVSGDRFTDNPGQSITADNPGSLAGSHNTDYIGYFEMLVPAGTYTLEVESIDSRFIGGSSVGPLSPPVPLPGPAEYWNQNESAFDFPAQRDTITVHAGQTIDNLNIILNGTPPGLDNNELSGMLLWFPRPCLVEKEFAA